MIRMYSKYERRTDTRSYEDRKKLYEGGWEVIRSEALDTFWKEKHDEWTKRPSRRLPKWFGERPGKKKGDPETPEGEEDALGRPLPQLRSTMTRRRMRRITKRERSKRRSLHQTRLNLLCCSKCIPDWL